MRKIILLAVTVLVIGGCSQHIGKTVNINNRGICKKSTDVCVAYSQDIKVEWRIVKEKDGGNSMNGKLTGSGIGISDYRGATFTLFLIKDSIVTEAIGMVSGGGDFNKGIPFSCDLGSKDFDATTIGYSFKYK